MDDVPEAGDPESHSYAIVPYIHALHEKPNEPRLLGWPT
jgi:hypothetical protein